jgi:hypothetical protein
MLRRVFQIIGAIALIGLLAIGGCQLTHLKASQPSSSTDWQQVEQQVEQTTVPTEAVLAGSNFNRFFPDPEPGYERIYTQEKNGFAEAKLKRNGQDLAMLSVSDILSNPTAASKYLTSSRQLNGYPVVKIGNTGTGLLVANRLQVKVLSRDETFTQEDREAWIQKFDLEGLSALVADD